LPGRCTYSFNFNANKNHVRRGAAQPWCNAPRHFKEEKMNKENLEIQEQERYKTLQRESTEKIRQKLKELTHLVRKGRSIVKNEIDQKRWVEFGIRTTR
jgi:hypothetical protein